MKSRVMLTAQADLELMDSSDSLPSASGVGETTGLCQHTSC